MELTLKIIFMLGCSIIAALLMDHWVYFKILRIAKEKDLVDNPDARKLQSNPIPVLGGLVVLIGAVAGIMVGFALHMLFELPDTPSLMPVLCAMVVMLYVGSMDDVVGLSPISRIVVEILVLLGMIYGTRGCIDTFHGLFGVYDFSWYIGVPLTVLTGVGIINAINMIDGVNGLSSGLCMVCSSLFGVAFLRVNDWANSIMAFSMAAALFPFILHNVFGKRSKMFIGDSGTMVMGIMLSWFVINMLRSDSPLSYYTTTQGVNMIALALAILSVPIADTLRVMTMRIINGKSPLAADKTHLHHMFIKAGVSHAFTSLLEIFIDCLIVGLWALSVAVHCSLELQLIVVIVSAMILVWGTYVVFRYNELRHTKFMHRLSHFSVHTHLGHKNWWQSFQEWLDRREEIDEEEERIHKEHLSHRFIHSDPEWFMEQQRELVLKYIKGKAEVHVSDIIKYSDAEEENVMPLLLEEIEKCSVIIIEQDNEGLPIIVAQNAN